MKTTTLDGNVEQIDAATLRLQAANTRLAAARDELVAAMHEARASTIEARKHGMFEHSIAALVGVHRQTVRTWLGKRR